MKEFLIKRVIKSKDLSSWLNSRKTLIYELEDSDKFPVKITYKTFGMDKNAIGNYIVLYKDIYNYSQPKNIDQKLNEVSLIELTTKENLTLEYRNKFGNDLSDEALSAILDYVINSGVLYEKYYVEDLKQKFMISY